MSSEHRITSDGRRGWDRARSVVECLVGIGVIALSAAMLALVVLAAVARFWTWIRNWWFWTGSVAVVLAEVKAERVTEPSGDGQRRTMNLLEELSIGLGRPVPELWVTKDQVPNALSMRSSSRRVVCTTSGVALLSRDRLEAMPAHELGHVWAQDAHWVGSGMVALARGRRAGLILLTTGAVTLVLLLGGWRSFGIAIGPSLFAIALMLLGAACTSVLRRLEMSMRRNADVIADAAAVQLARNPRSLAICVLASQRSTTTSCRPVGDFDRCGSKWSRRPASPATRVPKRSCGPVANWSSGRSPRTPMPSRTSLRNTDVDSSNGLPIAPPTPSLPDRLLDE